MNRTILTLALSALLVSSSCEQLKSFYRSPVGQTVIASGGAYIVSEAVQREPRVAPVLLALADQQEGVPVDFSAFDGPLVGLAVHTVGNLAAHYGDDVSAGLIVESIRTGVALAEARRGAK